MAIERFNISLQRQPLCVFRIRGLPILTPAPLQLKMVLPWVGLALPSQERSQRPRARNGYRTRTNTNPNDTEANAAGRSVRVALKSKLQGGLCAEGTKHNTSIPL
jgi:hypothetical protein